MNAETPDFDHLTFELIKQIDRFIRSDEPGEPSEVRLAIAEQLRQVWNARGAADREALAKHFMGGVSEHVQRSLNALDR